MAKGRKLALIVTGIGALSFSAFEPSFVPGMWASTSRLTDSRTDWRAELSNDVDDIDIGGDIEIWGQYTPVPVMPPRHRIPSKNVKALAALGGIPPVYAESLYGEAAGGNKYARAEIAKIRRKAKAMQTVPRRSLAMKRKLAWNMKEIERARKLSDTGMLSVEDARSTVARASSGSLAARDQIREIRQKLLDTANTGLLPVDEGRILNVRFRRPSLLTQEVAAHLSASHYLRSQYASFFAQDVREAAQLDKASETIDSSTMYGYGSSLLAQHTREVWRKHRNNLVHM